MTKRKYLSISMAITVLMIVLCGIITMSAAHGGSENPTLGEGLSRALIMIFGIIALIYLGITLFFKLIGIALRNNIYTVFVMIIDIISIAILSAIIISAVTEPSFVFTWEFVLEALPFIGLILLNVGCEVLDILSLKAPKMRAEETEE